MVHPKHDDVPSAMRFYLDYVMEQILDKNLLGLTTVTREDRPEYVQFLDSAGFERHYASTDFTIRCQCI